MEDLSEYNSGYNIMYSYKEIQLSWYELSASFLVNYFVVTNLTVIINESNYVIILQWHRGYKTAQNMTHLFCNHFNNLFEMENKKENPSIYTALIGQVVLSKRSDIDHTVLPANYTMPALPS